MHIAGCFDGYLMIFDHEQSAACRWFANREFSSRRPTIQELKRGIRRSAFVLLICASSVTHAHAAQPNAMLEAGAAEPVGHANRAGWGDRPAVQPLASAPNPTGDRREHGEQLVPLRAIRADVARKWLEVQSHILLEQGTLAACRSSPDTCSAAARQFLSIVELGHQHERRARIGQINRAVNLSIKPVSDLTQHGVPDFWSTPLATLQAGAGDCEDYAIVKYFALREIGIEPDDRQLIVVRDIKRHTLHAVLAVRIDQEWLFLDNRTLIIMNTVTGRYDPLFLLDHTGLRDFDLAAFRPSKSAPGM
jgi:predicted transglutaminase-like cysteine proteinase